jgi:4-amino-4-deoxy-L-arabinose transferase-like glycosyltransferase
MLFKQMKILGLFQRNQWVLLVYLTVTIALRFFTFFPSVINHDESTYMVVARDIFQGDKVLYRDIVDTKPPGIFILFGLIQKITGHSIGFFRVFTALFVGFTAYFIMLLSLKWHGYRNSAIASGFIYIFFISTWQFFGMSPNTELFFSFFNALGFFLLLHKRNYMFFLGGLAFGIGFIIKYSNLFDFLPVVFYVVVFCGLRKYKWYAAFFKLIISGLGFLIPFLVTNFYFYVTGNFEHYRFIAYEVPLKYSAGADWFGVLDRLVDFHVLFLPAIFFFYFILFRQNKDLRVIKLFVLIWLAFVFYSILLLGNTFPHYFIQFMLPMSLLAGLFFDTPIKYPGFLGHIFTTRNGIIVLCLFFLVKMAADYNDYYRKKDYAREVSDYLNERLTAADKIYTGNYHHIIYFLTGKESPTPYVHWTLIYYERLKRVLNIDNKEEVERIFSQGPKYVIIDGKLKEDIYVNLRQALQKDYHVEKSLDNRIYIYRRNGL